MDPYSLPNCLMKHFISASVYRSRQNFSIFLLFTELWTYNMNSLAAVSSQNALFVTIPLAFQHPPYPAMLSPCHPSALPLARCIFWLQDWCQWEHVSHILSHCMTKKQFCLYMYITSGKVLWYNPAYQKTGDWPIYWSIQIAKPCVMDQCLQADRFRTN